MPFRVAVVRLLALLGIRFVTTGNADGRWLHARIWGIYTPGLKLEDAPKPEADRTPVLRAALVDIYDPTFGAADEATINAVRAVDALLDTPR